MADTDGPKHHNRAAEIGPSILASDLSRLAEETASLEKCGANYIHLDVMDGHFVPNITLGAPVIKCLRKHSKSTFDAHMMVADPEKWVDDMADAGVDRFTFHIEATMEPDSLIDKIKGKGMKVGVAVKPGTPVETLFPLASKIDFALVMTVEPGFGGQKFMADMMPKVTRLRTLYPDLDIEVDGGVDDSNIHHCAQAGANFIVAGTFVFKGDRAERISLLRRAVEKYGNGKKDDDLSPILHEKGL